MTVLAAIGCCALTSCTKIKENKSEKEFGNQISSMNDKSSSTSESNNKSSTDSHKKNIDVKSNLINEISYPSFTGIDNEVEVNEIIYDYVSKINKTYLEEYEVALKANYKVTNNDERYVSIYFDGEVSGSMPYIRKFKETLNIDIENKKVIKLEDITNVNDVFVNKVYNDMTEKFKDMGLEGNPYTFEDVKELLEKSDKDDNSPDVQSFFSEDSIGIIISVPHVIGDYVEMNVSK